jgi:hypothetical protein
MTRCPAARCDQVGRVLHAIQRDIPGLGEIVDDSDDEDCVEELVITEEYAELREG